MTKSKAEKTVRDIRRRTRKHYSAEDKIRIVIEGLRGETSVAALCRREGINSNLYYRWSKDFLEAGKKRLAGDTVREANTGEVKALRCEAQSLKEALAESVLENRLLKKSLIGLWRRYVRYSASEKYELIQLVQDSDLSVRQTLKRLSINRSTFYGWLERYVKDGLAGLFDKPAKPGHVWNKISEEHQQAMVQMALDETDLSPRELAVKYTETMSYYVSESSMYRLLKSYDLITSPAYILMQAGDKFDQPSAWVNELWQTDFTYFKIIGWGWYYLSTILDDYSRFIVAWRLCTTMAASDVTDTLDDALAFTGLDQVHVDHKPRLLSDNGPCYISGQLADYLKDQGMSHTRGRPYHPQTQGKIERWHRSMKNQILLDHYYLPSELKNQMQRFVQYYNHERYHESLDNLTPADVYYGRGQEVLKQRKLIKQNTIALRRQLHHDNLNKVNQSVS
ncbi:IS3 family transposase [Marinicella sediminis]|uniref:IS3 family transposase n=1 Tax=Marinicella sediminis TaxID=1792834 RepID=A0ABV7JBQ2_9GAMM